MKTLFALVSIALSFSSCIEEESVSEYLLSNKSGKPIVIYSYADYFMNDSVKVADLDENEDTTLYFNVRGKESFVFLFSDIDSVRVIFNSNIAVTHSRDTSGGNTNRNITEIESWENSGNEESKFISRYSYEYTFTDADYQEALAANAKK